MKSKVSVIIMCVIIIILSIVSVVLGVKYAKEKQENDKLKLNVVEDVVSVQNGAIEKTKEIQQEVTNKVESQTESQSQTQTKTKLYAYDSNKVANKEDGIIYSSVFEVGSDFPAEIEGKKVTIYNVSERTVAAEYTLNENIVDTIVRWTGQGANTYVIILTESGAVYKVYLPIQGHEGKLAKVENIPAIQRIGRTTCTRNLDNGGKIDARVIVGIGEDGNTYVLAN